MQLIDTLHVVAELAVAFAGFASLVSIIGRRRGRDAPPIDAARIRSMLEASLLVAAFAFVPILMHEAGASIATSWRASSGAFALAIGVTIVFQVRRTLAALRHDYRPTRAWLATAGAVWLVALGALLATALGAVEHASFGYGLGLFCFLVYAGLLFVRLIASLLEGS